jgi:hypothetical protein
MLATRRYRSSHGDRPNSPAVPRPRGRESRRPGGTDCFAHGAHRRTSACPLRRPVSTPARDETVDMRTPRWIELEDGTSFEDPEDSEPGSSGAGSCSTGCFRGSQVTATSTSIGRHWSSSRMRAAPPGSSGRRWHSWLGACTKPNGSPVSTPALKSFDASRRSYAGR